MKYFTYIRRIIIRIKFVFCIGEDYYKGELYDFIDNSFSLIEKGIKEPDYLIPLFEKLYSEKLNPLKEFGKWLYGDRDVFCGQKIWLNRRVRIIIFKVPKGTSHPPHSHHGYVSAQTVLKGNLNVREYDEVSRTNHHVELKPVTNGIFKPFQTMINCPQFRNIHWFGAPPEEDVYILSIVKFKGLLGKVNIGRDYVDVVDGVVNDKGNIIAPILLEKQADLKYYNRNVGTKGNGVSVPRQRHVD